MIKRSSNYSIDHPLFPIFQLELGVFVFSSASLFYQFICERDHPTAVLISISMVYSFAVQAYCR